MTSLDQIRDDKGLLPVYAWPGGYPVVYITTDGGTFCPDCANGQNGSEARTEPGNYPNDGWVIVGHAIHWEGDPISCDHCNTEIESAYGPLEDTNQ